MAGFDFSLLNPVLQSYYEVNRVEINYALLQGFNIRKYMRPRTGIISKYTGISLHLKQLLQPHQNSTTAFTDSITFQPEVYILDAAKADYPITEEDIIALSRSYAGNWTVPTSNYDDFGVFGGLGQEFFNIMMMRADAELERLAWKGVFVAPTPGTPGLFLTITDGIEKRLTDAIAANKITPFLLGPYTPDATREYIEDFYNELPDAVKSIPMDYFVSRQTYTDYWKGIRDDFGQNMNYNPTDFDIPIPVMNTPHRVVPFNGMQDSKRIFATPPQNMIYITDNSAQQSIFKLYNEAREMIVKLDFKLNFGFEVIGLEGGDLEDQWVFLNDQA